MIDIAAVHHYPEVLRAFRETRPDVALHLVVESSGNLLAQLRRGALDLVVCVAPPHTAPDLLLEQVAVDDLCVYAPNGARVGAPATWGPWVMFPEDAHTRHVVIDALERLGASTDVVGESHQPDVLAAMVSLGVGWTVLPSVQAEHGAQPLRRARAKPIARRSLVAARRIDSITDPAADALLVALRGP
jgi:DNA-binding transcriptional LysR family regulator